MSAPSTIPGETTPSGWLIEPLHFAVAVVSAFVIIVIARAAIADPDVWWHRDIGAEILETWSVRGLGNEWAPFGDQAWVTTQWLSEVALYGVQSVAGWQGVVGMRVLVSTAILLGLAFTVLPGRPARAAVPVFVLAAIGLTPGLTQDRPQSLGLLLAVPLGLWIVRSLGGRPPPWWQVMLLSALWSNLHGSWVLVPAVFALLAVASLLDPNVRNQSRPLASRAALAVVAGLLNPAWWDSLVAVVRFQGQTSHLTEWQPTLLLDVVALPFSILLTLVVISWARSLPIPTSELVVVIGLTAFALVSFRNVLFAYPLLSPLVAERLGRKARARPAGAAEARALVTVGAGVAIAGLVTAMFFSLRSDPLDQVEPRRIAATLADIDGPKRILNDYNIAGVLLAFGGEGVELAIDGRADRYSAEYVDRHLGALARLIEWEAVIEEVQPDYAVLAADQALPVHLTSLGWTTMQSDGGYMLLAPPP